MSDEEKRIPDPDRFKMVEPVKMFDDLFYIGNKVVGIYVLKTSEGLVLIDATENPDAYDEIVVPSLEKLGLSDEKILVLFLTHGHFDHYYGAKKIQEMTRCEVALSTADCAFMVQELNNIATMELTNRPIPRVTMRVEDGDIYTYGDHSIEVIYAPGHTPGCLNYSFDVHDNGEKHRIALMGGYGVFGPGEVPSPFPYAFSKQTAVDNALIFASTCAKFWEYTVKNNCDVYLNPHPHLCDLFQHAEKNKIRKEGEPNAFVIGPNGVKEWIFDRFDACVKAAGRFSGLV